MAASNIWNTIWISPKVHGPDRIRIDISGARAVRLDEQGNLIVDTRSGELRQLAPRVFQTDHGVRRQIPAKYVLLSAHEIGFQLGKHNRSIPLTIDPVIVYTKYFGGSASDTGGPVATDAQGNVYVTGSTDSINFPSTNGTKVRLQPPLLAYSNAGQTVTPLPVGTEVSVTAIGGTADGNVLYVATPDGIFVQRKPWREFRSSGAFDRDKWDHPHRPGDFRGCHRSLARLHRHHGRPVFDDERRPVRWARTIRAWQ